MRTSDWVKWIIIAVFTGVGLVGGALHVGTVTATITGPIVGFIFIYSLVAVVSFILRTILTLIRRLTSRLIVEPDELGDDYG